MSTTAVILAAQPGDGFSESKYLAPIRGIRLLDKVVSTAREWPVDDIVVVIGSDAEAIAEVCDLSDVSVIVDPEWSEGSAASMRAVLDFVSRDRGVRRVVVARGDQPGVTSEVVGGMLEMARDTGAESVIPKYRYAQGWPVVINRSAWDLFLGLEGEAIVHDVLVAHGTTIEEMWIDQIAPQIYDTPDDLPGSR